MGGGIELPELGSSVASHAVGRGRDTGLALGVADRTGGRTGIIVVREAVTEVRGACRYLPHHGRVTGQAGVICPCYTGHTLDMTRLAVTIRPIVIQPKLTRTASARLLPGGQIAVQTCGISDTCAGLASIVTQCTHSGNINISILAGAGKSSQYPILDCPATQAVRGIEITSLASSMAGLAGGIGRQVEIPSIA